MSTHETEEFEGQRSEAFGESTSELLRCFAEFYAHSSDYLLLSERRRRNVALDAVTLQTLDSLVKYRLEMLRQPKEHPWQRVWRLFGLKTRSREDDLGSFRRYAISSFEQFQPAHRHVYVAALSGPRVVSRGRAFGIGQDDPGARGGAAIADDSESRDALMARLKKSARRRSEAREELEDAHARLTELGRGWQRKRPRGRRAQAAS